MPPSTLYSALFRFLPRPPQYFTQNAPKRLFFNWNRQPGPRPVVRDYPALVASRMRLPWLAPPLDHQALSRMIIKHSDADEYGQVLRIFNDLETIWECKPSPQDVWCYLRASGRTGTVAEALHWIEVSAGAATERFRHELLASCVRFKDGLAVVEHKKNIQKSERDYSHLLRLAIAEGLIEERTRLLEEMAQRGLNDSLLVHGCQLEVPRSLAFVMKRLEEGIVLEHWIEMSLIAHLCRTGDQNAVFEVLTRLVNPLKPREDSTRSINLLETLMLSIRVPENLNEAQSLADRLLDLTGIDIFQHVKLASILFDRLSIIDNFDCLINWCQIIDNRNGPILAKCIGAMLKFKSSVISKPGLLRRLWEDLGTCTGSNPEERRNLAIDFLRLSVKFDPTDWELSQRILDVLMTQRLPLRPELLEDLVVHLIELAPSRDAAFQSYEKLLRIGSPSRAFFERSLVSYAARCETPSAGDAHLKSKAVSMLALSAIFEHMRAADIPPDTKTYVNLLRHYSNVVKANPRNQSTRLQVERLHLLLKLDPYVEPNTLLLAHFFKAFAYNGMFAQAWSVWTQLSGEERFRVTMGNGCVATMLDLAGYESEAGGNGRLNVQAIDGWARLIDPNVSQWWPECKANKNLWDSWVECLCRARHFQEAADVVLEEMSKNGFRPDARTCSVLLRFCRRESEWKKQNRSVSDDDEVGQDDLFMYVRSRIKDKLPEVWNEVCHEGLTPQEIEEYDKLENDRQNQN